MKDRVGPDLSKVGVGYCSLKRIFCGFSWGHGRDGNVICMCEHGKCAMEAAK